jgi:hyaluronoglucosaminidase
VTCTRQTLYRLAITTAAAFASLLTLVAPGPAAAAPPAWRGIIEGAYGTPWDHAARMRIINWMPAHGFTSYVHAPKDELEQRALWRSPFSPAELRDFAQEIAVARQRHVRWIPNLSPGIAARPTDLPTGVEPSAPLCFSCPEDAQAVVDKLGAFLDAGVRTVMVSFDDVVERFSRPEDTAAFGSDPGAYGAANGAFLNQVYDLLQVRAPGTELLTVPADYAGTTDTPYLQGLRATLRPAVHVMWTGTRVRSMNWQPADAAKYAALIGRKPIVWDNWTNNDFVVDATSLASARLFLGPYTRAPNVAGSVDGWFFNPASEADVNMLPLATAGDWLRNPYSYDARASWLRAVAEIARNNPALSQTLRAFAETSYSTRLSRVEGPTFVRLTRLFLGSYDQGPYWTRALAALRVELALARSAPQTLSGLADRAFYDQTLPFLSAGADAASAGIVAATLLEAERPALSAQWTPRGGFVVTAAPAQPSRADMLRSLLAGWRTRIGSSARLVYGWRSVDGQPMPPYATQNVMDAFLNDVAVRDAAWRAAAAPGVQTLAITVAGRPGPVPANGTFPLSGRNCGLVVIARDSAGGQTSMRLPGCRRQPGRR